MTPERENTIRALWGKHERHGLKLLEQGQHLNVPYPKRTAPAISQAKPQPEAEKMDILVYRLEHGTIEHRPMSRVVCEGVEVAVFPRATR